jgi:hypothetical protein
MSRIFFFLLTLFSASSSAFTTLDPYMVDAEVRRVNEFISVDGNNVKVNITGKGYGANQPYFNKTVTIPKANFLSWVKANLKNLMKINPWWIAWAAAMAAAGWAFDALLGQMTHTLAVKYGQCRYGSINYGDSVTLEACAKSIIPPQIGTYVSYTHFGGPNPPLLGQLSEFFSNYKTSSGYNSQRLFSFQPKSSQVEIKPVPDDVLLDNIFPEMMANPKVAAQAMTAPGGYPYGDLFKNVDLKYIPGVSEADYPALDCYFRGALQSSNAAGACYATEAEYQRVKQIAEQIKAHATPGGATNELNDQLKDPLTQAQFEESLNKLKDSDVSKVTDDASKIYDDGFKQLNDSLVANTLPSMPDLIPLPQFQTGSCRSITFQFSFAGRNVTKQFPGDLGCVQLEKMKEFLGWLMAIAVSIGLIFAALREAN